MPSKPIIAVDIDDVLYPTAAYLADVVGAVYGVKLDGYRMKLRLRDEIAVITGADPAEVALAAKNAFLDDSLGEMRPFPAGVAALKQLRDHYQIVALTARSPESHELTERVIRRDFAGLVDEVYFPNGTEWSEPLIEVDKATHLHEMGAAWLIDDKLDHLAPLSGTAIRGGLFGDYVWNRQLELPQGIIRLADWDAVLAALLPR